MSRTLVGRSMLGVLSALAGVTWSVPAAADVTQTCIEAASAGQQLRDDGKLVASREKFLRCSRDECPRPVAADCLAWAADVETRLPTVVLGARGANGADLLRVRLTVDGIRVADLLDGRAMTMDPGPHALVFEADGASTEQKVVLREGEKNRPILVVLGDAGAVSGSRPKDTTPIETRTSAWPLWVSVGVSVVAMSAFAFFGATGQSDKGRLEASCAVSRTCAQDDVDAARTKLIVADVALGVGILSLATATYVGLRGLSAPQRPTPAR